MTRPSPRCGHIVQILGTIGRTLAACAVAQLAAADDVRAPAPRVRSEHPTIVRLIAQATEGSATFRRELEKIGATDGIVYVHDAPCGRGVKACLMHTVQLAGPYRLLRVKVDLRRPEADTMSSLGHELQHAIEALSDPGVTSNSRISAFFRQLAATDSYSSETPAALRAGYDVFNELRSNARQRRLRPDANERDPAAVLRLAPEIAQTLAYDIPGK